MAEHSDGGDRSRIRQAALAAADDLVGPEGWAYASADSVEAGDPGRFHALFGRDSLIFALQVLQSRPEVAAATLRALAAKQGRHDDPETEEQPGRILHEYRPDPPARLVEADWPVRDGEICYYGSSDSTSWFLVVLDATGDSALQSELAPAARAAGDWLAGALRTGRGFVRCGPRRYPGGLEQQGWRDTDDPGEDEHGGGIVTETTEAPTPPLADADSQAVALVALDALTRLDPGRSAEWAARHTELQSMITGNFGPDTMAVDGADHPVAGAGSQLGWLLWAGAWSAEEAAAVAERIARTDLLTPYGVRTLSSGHAGFLTEGYHRGAIWPFDNWLVWRGLHAAGRPDLADRCRDGVLAALHRLGRYPELYAVDTSNELRAVPIANRVQAWTIGAVVGFTDD